MIPALLAAGAAAAGGLSIYDRIRAEQARNDALGYYNGLESSMPSAKDLSVDYTAPEYSGDLSAIGLGDTSLAGVQANPELEVAQLAALRQIQGVAENQGFTPADKARMQLAEARAAQQNRAAQDAVMANARARGIAGSGLEMINRQMAGQQAAQDRALAGAQLTASAGDRALQAMANSGSMAGQISDRQYGRQAGVASARDAIARFNAANTQQVRARNLDARQQQMNALANARNQSAASRAGAAQAAWNNRMGLSNARAGIQTGNANQYADWSGQGLRIAGGVMQAMGGQPSGSDMLDQWG